MPTTTFKKHKNNAFGTLSANITSGATSCTLQVGEGTLFPATGTFWATLFDPDIFTHEIVLATLSAGDTFTITRGQQGTGAAAWNSGANFQLLWTAGSADQITDAINDIEDGTTTLDAVNVAGAATIVGDTTTANLTLTSPTPDFKLKGILGGVVLQAQAQYATNNWYLAAYDGDGTDDVYDVILGVGTSTQLTNTEVMAYGYIAADQQFFIRTQATGTGTLRSLTIATEGNDDQLTLETTGELTADTIHNNDGSGTTGKIASGTYTPTITAVTNVASSANPKGNWLRVGNIVNVAVTVDIDPTAGGSTVFGVSLPFSSNFTNTYDLNGVGVCIDSASDTDIVIAADTTNDRANCTFTASGGTPPSRVIKLVFQFEVK